MLEPKQIWLLVTAFSWNKEWIPSPTDQGRKGPRSSGAWTNLKVGSTRAWSAGNFFDAYVRPEESYLLRGIIFFTNFCLSHKATARPYKPSFWLKQTIYAFAALAFTVWQLRSVFNNNNGTGILACWAVDANRNDIWAITLAEDRHRHIDLNWRLAKLCYIRRCRLYLHCIARLWWF